MKGRVEVPSNPLECLKDAMSNRSTKTDLRSMMAGMPISAPKGGVDDEKRARRIEMALAMRAMKGAFAEPLPVVPAPAEKLPAPTPTITQPEAVPAVDLSTVHPYLDNEGLLYIPNLGVDVAMHKFAWTSANFITVSSITCAAVVSIQSPIKTMVVTLMKESVLLPTNVVGVYGCAKFLYAGTRAQLTGAGARTAYITEAKDVKPYDDTRLTQTAYLMGISWGELVLTQPSESLSTFKKARLLPTAFNWKTPSNLSSLVMAGMGPRYCSGLINLGCLCMLTDSLADQIPGNREFAKTTAGAISGIIAAIASHPTYALKEYTLLKSKFENGQLQNASTLGILKKIMKELKTAPKDTLWLFFNKNTAKSVSLRAMNTSLIFGIVSGLAEFLGKEPLDKVIPGANPKAHPNGFFRSDLSQRANSTAPAVETPRQDQSIQGKQ